MTFGLHFSPLSRLELVDRLVSDPVPEGDGARVICTANLDHIVQLQSNSSLREAYDKAWSVTADGMPVYAYARFRHDDVPGRVTGSDLVKDLVGALDPARHRCFFVVSCSETAVGLAMLMQQRGFHAQALRFVVPPFGFEHDKAFSEMLARQVKGHETTHLFFGVGAPKSEIWTHTYRHLIGDCYVLNAGAGLDYACGVKKRAPSWMQHSGLEWVWRVGAEPRRLARRYFVHSWVFLLAVCRDLLSRTDTRQA